MKNKDDGSFVTHQSMADTGTVVSLWRYPVKSMMGEELNSSLVTERGLIGDRAYAVVDKQTGKAASAKNPRKWGKLFDFRSIFVDSPNDHVDDIRPVRITFPDGSNGFSDHQDDGNDINSRLSEVFNREVTLMKASDFEEPSYEEYWPNIDGLARRDQVTDEAMPSKTFFDIAVIHILTTSSINRLRELYPEGRFEVRRFRPNIVIESADSKEENKKNNFIENLWVGKKMTIGEDVVLNITAPCTRCVMITLPQGDLPRDLGILSTVAKYNQVHVGVYASVERGGIIHRGDAVRIEEK
ncbi:MAG TPA: MOSC domain-containing protein [Nitrososphaeraceae archaeon]|nr:MOSC domain-containing protein [Nitrososphaeraceae archaeon]